MTWWNWWRTCPGEAPASFHVLAKPTGAICNLDCRVLVGRGRAKRLSVAVDGTAGTWANPASVTLVS